MSSTLLYREVVKEDYCPECGEFLIHGITEVKQLSEFNGKELVYSVCLHCGYRRNLSIQTEERKKDNEK